MGILGLMTYITRHSDIYLQNYSLHDTFLVIDGNSVASQLYSREAKGNCCFGGDYDKYAWCVSNFFDELLKCNITPLIIIDGGSEDKKLSTIYKRTKDRVRTACGMTPQKQARTQLFPLLLKEVFKNTVKQKGIKCAQSLFEADDDIASVAKILNCPVLSFDSDFYIFDVMYIPFNTLDFGVVKNPNGNGFMKNCKVYKIDNFLSRFPGMDKTVMPLAATLLGNDYINRSTFKDFFSTLRLSKTSKRRYNEQQRRIEATFRWLQKQSLDSAIAIVLSKLDQKKRKQILEIMEMVINGYLIASPRMLYPLGFSNDYINHLMRGMPNKPYKFQQDINNLKIKEEPKADDESDLSCSEDDSPSEELEIVKPENESHLYSLAPKWFIEEFNAAHFPSYFIDMLTRQLYVCPVQVEDFSHPTCINISLKILRVIFKLLSAGTTNSNVLEYVARSNVTNITTYKLQCEDHIFFCKFPSLSQLRALPLIIRKQILDNTLGISDNLLNEFPPEWRLYIATAKYWINEADAPFRTNCHLYALLFVMLYHVIDRKAGFHRSQSYFERKYGQHLKMLYQHRNNTMLYSPAPNMPIFEALNRVDPDDCLLAIPFFLSNFIMDERLLMNPKKFHISSVHGFSLFQNALRHSTHLNALLGFPYQQTNVAELFNGTLIYNLYNNLKSRHDIDVYISTVLRNSPSLLQLFVSIMATIRSIFTEALETKINTGRRKKNRNRRKNDLHSDDNVLEDDDDFQNDVPYYDVNNRYAALNTHFY
ncbi:protein asteroid [Nasonia vitripennis]|uniref:XPG N-terminal domain-containing protein n=1 Tax=Nasonia vitripennis TaxID=7425 RepID=A0A7M7Q8K3_NASVI|nr:protein asteroid [Nasonia vitripennis]